MLIADVGITDYSSWICDYLLTKKTGFIFATDMQNYNTERGFYYPYSNYLLQIIKPCVTLHHCKVCQSL